MKLLSTGVRNAGDLRVDRPHVLLVKNVIEIHYYIHTFNASENSKPMKCFLKRY